jgi:NADH pyrophosphatase NudC (nudix superfamily)
LDGVSVNDDPQVYAPEMELDTKARERTGCTEEWEERRDVAIWTVQWDSPSGPTHEHEEGDGQKIKVSQTAAETKFWSNTQSILSTSDSARFCFDWDL